MPVRDHGITTLDAASPTTQNSLDQLLHARRSCRAFLPEPVPRRVIEGMVRLAGRAPSWCNTQPWQLIITEADGTEQFRRRLIHDTPTPSAPDFEFPQRYVGVYQGRRVECALQMYDELGIRGDRQASAKQAAQNFALFGAPHVAVVTTPADLGPYGAIDCGAFLMAFLLAAESVGVGAVPQAAIAGRAPAVRDHFGLQPDQKIVCAVSFGWPDHQAPVNQFRTSRIDPMEAVTWVG